MSTELVDYAAILADLEAKKSALEATITSFRAAMALGALGQAGDLPPDSVRPAGPVRPGDLPAGFALGKSIPEAAKLYLSMVKQKQTSSQIAEALIKGGMETTSKNFVQILHSGLDRARKSPNSAIIKLGRSHWGLAEWYPAGVRSTGAAPAKNKKAKKKEGKKPSAPAAAAPKAEQGGNEKAAAPQKGGAEEAVLRALSAGPQVDVSAKDIAEKTGLKIQTVHLILGKLANKNKAQKSASGGYRIAG